MSSGGVGIVWIAGAAGSGKSAAAWALFRRLAEQGVGVAFVDIDQLGMLYPEPEGDPWAHQLKANALATLLPGYTAHGARVVIVAGVVDPACGPRPSLPAGTNLTVVVLTPGAGDLRERLVARGWSLQDAAESVAEGDVVRRAEFADLVIDTAALSVADTVERLLPTVSQHSDLLHEPNRVRASSAPTSVVAITGARAVGTSTVGFEFASRRWREHEATAFVDAEQLSFISSDDTRSAEDLAARQLAAMHEFMAANGAELFVVCGPPAAVHADSLRAAAPAASHLIVRLRADRATVESHVRERSRGSQARLAGDDILGADATYQAHVVATSVAEQELLDVATRKGERTLDVTGRSADDVVDELDRLATERAIRS